MTEAELRKENALLRANINTLNKRIDEQMKLLIKWGNELDRLRRAVRGIPEPSAEQRRWWEMPTRRERERDGQ